MMRNALLLSLLLSPQAFATALPVTWSLAGEWRVHDANDPAFDGVSASSADWRTLRMPAHWSSHGLDHQGAPSYRHSFTLPAQSADTLATLVFDGVDYLAAVPLHGQHLAHHQRS